jgi:hypothetical protein
MHVDRDQEDHAHGAQDAGHLVVDRTLERLLGSALRASEPGNEPVAQQVQPASVDLRLASTAWRVRCGFLPGSGPATRSGAGSAATSVEDRLAELGATPLSLEGAGAVLERGQVYLVPLQEAAATSSRAFSAKDTHGSTKPPRVSRGSCGSRSHRCRSPSASSAATACARCGSCEGAPG